MACAPAAASARALGHPRPRAQVRGRRARPGPVARPSSTASPAAAAPSSPVTPTRSPGRAPSRPTSASGVGRPADDGHGDRQRRAGGEVAAGDRQPARAPRTPRRRACSASTSSSPSRGGQHDREVGLARGGAHRREVGRAPASARQPASSGVARRRAGSACRRPSRRPTSTAHAAGAHDGGVVADPAHARAIAARRRSSAARDRLDQRATLAARSRLSGGGRRSARG